MWLLLAKDNITLTLVYLTGTIPSVYFRDNNVYNIPVTIYITEAYPFEPPVVFVTPSASTETFVKNISFFLSLSLSLSFSVSKFCKFILNVLILFVFLAMVLSKSHPFVDLNSGRYINQLLQKWAVHNTLVGNVLSSLLPSQTHSLTLSILF